MAFFLGFFIFMLGLLVGSFLNCVIYRLEHNESFLTGRSYCPHCKHKLLWLDLIPVLSFLILKGECRYCQKPISRQYPVVEISTALIFLLTFNFLPFLAGLNQFSIGEENRVLFFTFASIDGSSVFNFLNLIYYWIISSFLIIIFVYDLKHYIIPDKVIFPAIVIAFLYQLFRILASTPNFGMVVKDLALGILPSLFFLAIIVFSRGKWMGFGDFKLAIFMGFFLGWPNILVALFLAFFLGAAVGIGLIITQKKTLKSEVPFGPFLAVGTIAALSFGQNIINWYSKCLNV